VHERARPLGAAVAALLGLGHAPTLVHHLMPVPAPLAAEQGSPGTVNSASTRLCACVIALVHVCVWVCEYACGCDCVRARARESNQHTPWSHAPCVRSAIPALLAAVLGACWSAWSRWKHSTPRRMHAFEPVHAMPMLTPAPLQLKALH